MIRIKQLRTEKKLSQRTLASRINVSQKAIDLWEKGLTEPKSSVIAALSDVFECSADYLLEREDDIGSVNVMRDLTQEEKNVLRLFDELDKKQKDELISFAEFLISKN